MTFEPFAELNPLHHSLFSQPAWAAAASTFKQTMAPIEAIVARKLSTRFASSGLKANALLREFVRYQELVRREAVFAQLAPARETLLGSSSNSSSTCATTLRRAPPERRSKASAGRSVAAGKNLPEVVEHLVQPAAGREGARGALRRRCCCTTCRACRASSRRRTSCSST